jgi:hypothetical protein
MNSIVDVCDFLPSVSSFKSVARFFVCFPDLPPLSIAQISNIGQQGNMADFIRGADRELVRDYITAADHMQYAQLPSDVVAILLTHSNLSASHPDIRINLHTTVSAVQLLMIFYHN